MIIFQTDPAPAPAALIPTSPLSPHSKDVGVVTNVAWQSGPDAALALDHDAQLKQTYLPSYGEHKNIYIGDAVSSTQDDKEKPITSGFFRVEKGGKATATYTYFEVKVIVEDTLIVSDGTGQKVTAVKGDILYFPKDSTRDAANMRSSQSSGKFQMNHQIAATTVQSKACRPKVGRTMSFME
ncbi:hypothetical protein MBLNU459_g8295t1 [Dothideomycetes sp. NU459]